MSLDAPVDIAGVDGCKGGWIAVIKRVGELPVVGIHASFQALLDNLSETAIVAVDMPIGLPAGTTKGGRGPESIIRDFLSSRRSSVFSIPSREAVYATTAVHTTREQWYADHQIASAVAKSTSDPERGVSIQAFGIFSKIQEIDKLLLAGLGLSERVIESHPELAFWTLNGQVPMALPKKIKGHINPVGMLERRRLLSRCGYAPDFVERAPPSGAASDDFLDACAMLLIAARRANKIAVPYPDPPGQDEHGLPIAIWA